MGWKGVPDSASIPRVYLHNSDMPCVLACVMGPRGEGRGGVWAGSQAAAAS